jgi:integrase
MPVAQWPARDAALWAAALEPGDPFTPGGLASRWAPSTQRQVSVAYGRWLTWLDIRGELDREVGPGDRITRERVTLYVSDLAATISPFTVASYVQLLNDALRAMVPDVDWKWIGRAPGRIRQQAVPSREKRSRLQTPDRLVELGIKLMTEAEREFAAAPLEAAIRFRSGLTIAFLAYRPIRMENLEAMRCDEHLTHRNGTWRVAFRAAEVKARRPLEFPFPASLVSFLKKYLTVYRPILLAGDPRRPPASKTTALWVSREGQPLGYQTIGYHIQRHTQAEFGAPINAHLFRDCAATFIAIVDPEHVRIIAAILGHATMRTSERHYNQAKGLEAGRRHVKTIQTLRAAGRRGAKAVKQVAGQAVTA